MKKNCKKQIKRSFELKKQSRKMTINYMLNKQDTMICLVPGHIKSTV